MRLEEYDPVWAERFAVEAGRLRAVLAPWLAPEGVEHIGSTAVPGLKAKPIVDMLAAVRSLTEARAAFRHSRRSATGIGLTGRRPTSSSALVTAYT
jgi:GrpB-like predicted nucleotidyltransferase (UPF0157 family)